VTANGQHLHTLFKLVERHADDAKAKWYCKRHMWRFDLRKAHRVERLKIAAAKYERWSNRYAK
jgi:hypothetical protein